MTLFFPNHQIQIYRNRKIAGANRFAMSATFTVYSTDIQPASDQRAQMATGAFGAVFTAFVDTNADIKAGDKIHVVGGQYDGKIYSVSGVQRWEGAGMLDHLELLMVSQDG